MKYLLLVALALIGCQGEVVVGSNRLAVDAMATEDAMVTQPACRDSIDNDEDGLIDFPYDPGCAGLSDGDETDPAVPTACSDGSDNDIDGISDFPEEPGCHSASDNDEVDPVPPADCSDGLDNDGDLNIDYPADPGCKGAGDDGEGNVTS